LAAVGVDQQRSSLEAATVDATLAGGVNSAVSSFSSSAHAAQADLEGLMWACLILVALIVIGVLAGTRPRLREYR
jgi:hypothetical protein